MHAPAAWLLMAAAVTAAILIWLAIKPQRRVSLVSLLVLLTLLAVAFAVSRWRP